MTAYQMMAKLWKKKDSNDLKEYMRQMAIKWRREPSIIRIEKPTKLDRARRLGYKAKQGFVVIRIRVRRSGARKTRPVSGRRQKAMGVTKIKWAKGMKRIAEERVSKRFPNLKVLNSYLLWSDGKFKWYEVLLLDPNHPVISKSVK
ncbi:MAG: 50S ribosomal protein L15e [Candidatus Bathyarchaeota archaeon]|nr:50S ribosomal protein L15e [Candidatus Bathyarchaeota archaeon]MCZ2844905.1 50S ribosomal protein L15e [Candidatus Bathyarchaeota archaeon]